jgi:3-oxoacyl-(acyl-carrier-protein) synthase
MRAVITGAGAVTPFGAGLPALVEGILAGRSAVGPEPMDGAWRRALWAARVRDPIGPGPFSPMAWRRLDRCSRMAALAALEALASAGETARPAAGGAGDGGLTAEVGVVLGTMSAGVEPLRDLLTALFREGPQSVSPMVFPFTVPNAAASQCSILLGLKGPNLTVCQMEASGLGAIAAAAMLIEEGAAEAILAGGVDEAPSAVVEAWSRMRILAPARDRRFRGPFDARRAGFAPGEGAYVVLLESAERAARRGARPWAEVAGTATVHARGPAHAWPGDAGEPRRAVSLALERAGLRAADLGYVAASANGAQRLDAVEAEALGRALGSAAERVPVSALKGALGESAAGCAAAALLAALSIRDGFVPPTAGLADPASGVRLEVVGEARRGPVRAVLVNALATGGTCVSVVLSRPAA